jgi:hypothetical protein
MKRFVVILSLTIFTPLMLSTACINTNKINIVGKVTYIENGKFYGIVSDTGKNYYPVNLDEEYKINELRVKIQANYTDQVNIHQWGTTIKIVTISENITNC